MPTKRADGRFRAFPRPQQSQQHIDSVEHNPAGAELALLGLENGQQAARLEVAGLYDRRRESGVEKKHCITAPHAQPPAERRGVGANLVGAFLEGDKDTGLLALA